MFGIAVSGKDFHVARVRGSTVGRLGRDERRVAHNFAKDGVLTRRYEGQRGIESDEPRTYLQVGQVGTVLRVVLFTQEQVPQTTGFCLFLEVLHDGHDGRPSFLEGMFGDLGMIEVFGGKAFVLRGEDKWNV